MMYAWPLPLHVTFGKYALLASAQVQVNMEDVNDIAFGKVSGDMDANADCSFEDNFSAPSQDNSPSDLSHQCDSWRADGYLQSLGKWAEQ